MVKDLIGKQIKNSGRKAHSPKNAGGEPLAAKPHQAAGWRSTEVNSEIAPETSEPQYANAGKRTCILILGMHRSGTSALARLVSMLGATLPRHILSAGQGNEAGHWEPKRLVDLHDIMLAEAGSSWDDWRTLNLEAQLPDSRLEYYKSKISSLIEEEYGSAPLFVLKDPRISRFLPFYQEILENMGILVRVAMIVRNPLEVAASLHKRDGLVPAQAALYWLRHVLDAERTSRVVPRAVVTYNKLLLDWRSALADLDVLDVEWPISLKEIATEIQSFVRSDLRHHVHDLPDPHSGPREFWQYEVWTAIGSKVIDAAKLDKITGDFARYEAVFGDLFDAERRLVEHTRQVLVQAQGAQEAAAAEVERMKENWEEVRRETEQRFKRQLEDMRANLIEQQHAVVEAERAAAAAKVNALLNSTSWKLTAPIRGLKLILMRLAKGGEWLGRYLERFLLIARSQGIRSALRATQIFFEKKAFRAKPKNLLSFERNGAQIVTSMRSSSILEIRNRGVLISILMPVYNTPPKILEETIESVLRQSWVNWELCICDDCSTSPETLEVLDQYRGRDYRIKIIRSPQNLHIARATNLAAELAVGEFVAFLDHDDVLEPDALELIVEVIANDSEVDFVYTDEDKLESDGSLSEPYLKPDWSPEHLQSVMYTMHFTAIRKSLFLELGCLRPEYSGAQDYDLALRASKRARKIVHVPKVLYHWRKIPGSAAEVVDAKPDALVNAKRALTDFVKTVDPQSNVEDGLLPGTYRVRWPVDQSIPVTLLILTDARRKTVAGRGNILLIEHLIDSIVAKSTFTNYRIVVVDNQNLPAEVREKIERNGGKVISYNYEGAFNFSAKMNFSLDQVTTEDVILMNDDLEVITPDWVECLLEYSRQSDIGAVGARLLFPNERIQHAGVVLGVNGSVAHLFHNMPAGEVGYYGYTHLIRNYSAVTGAVLATQMSIVKRVGKFDETMRIDFNDIDFCLRIGEAGYRIVYTPFCQLYHFEGGTETRITQDQADKDAFFARWAEMLDRDPFYNPQLPQNRIDCYVRNWLQTATVAPRTRYTQPVLINSSRTWKVKSGTKLGVNFIGPVDVISGLGVSARGYVEALQAAGVPLNVIPWRKGFEHQSRIKAEFPKSSVQQVNIIHLNADILDWALPQLIEYMDPNSYNIGIWYWELSSLRPEWLVLLDMFDEIWSSSSFLVAAIESQSRRPVRLVRPALSYIEHVNDANRGKFGLQHDSYVFLYAFDLGSVVERKNPLALIEAFRQEFCRSDKAQLLLKIHYPDPQSSVLADLRRLVADTPSIVIIDMTLSSEDMKELWSCCDCYVSPHRSEGLGLTVIEAMYASKPVILTPYGGVSDFALPDLCLPINFRLAEIPEDFGPYPKGYVWAEPDIASLRASMRTVFEDPNKGTDIGQAGRAHVEQLFSLKETGRVIKEELERIAKLNLR